MPRPAKLIFNNTALFITTSVEEGFMFPTNPLIESILLSCLARAQQLHPVEVSHFVVEATHVHFIARVGNPDDIKGFMERFKTESAHAINRLLGRKKRTIWCAGYDSPVLLTVDTAIDKIAYTYLNPSNDNLAESIGDYAGFSSWKAFLEGSTKFKAKLIARTDIQPLKVMDERSYQSAADSLAKDKPDIEFTISPNAWMKCFGITAEEDIAKINERIKQRVRDEEKKSQAQRLAAGRTVMGKSYLLNQRIGAAYTPNRDGKRMYCISSDIELRKQFISWVKRLIAEAKEVLAQWRLGNIIPYPLGLYPPSFPKLASLIYC